MFFSNCSMLEYAVPTTMATQDQCSLKKLPGHDPNDLIMYMMRQHRSVMTAPLSSANIIGCHEQEIKHQHRKAHCEQRNDESNYL